MIPLIWLLAGWTVLVGLLLLLSAVTLMMHIRFGLSGFGTTVTATGFAMVILAALILTSSYLLTVDWSQTLNVFSDFSISIPSPY